MISAELIERARGVDLKRTAERLGVRLKRVTAAELAGPWPACNGRDRFAINIRKQVWHCRHCEKGGGDVISLAMHMLGLDFRKAVAFLAGDEVSQKTAPPVAKIVAEPAAPNESDNREKAQRIWARRQPVVEDSPVRRYLRARGYEGQIPATIGFLPARGQNPPCMIAAIGMADEPEPGVLAIAEVAVRAIHLTRVRPDGSGKAGTATDKVTIGQGALGAPIILAPPNDLLGLAITEGLEDALSVHAATGLAAWAATSAGRMPALAEAIPGYIECVTVLGHRDEAGERGARELSARLIERGFETIPQKGASGVKRDANDILREEGVNALRRAIDEAQAERIEPRPSAKNGDGRDGDADKREKPEKDDVDKKSGEARSAISDDLLAEVFAEKRRDNLRFVAEWGRWFAWRDGVWRRDTTLEIFHLIRESLKAHGVKGAMNRMVGAVYGRVRADRRIVPTIAQWDGDPWTLKTSGGGVDLKTGALEMHDPKAYCTKSTAIAPGSDRPRFKAFLKRIMQGDEVKIAYLQRFFGYCLTGDISEHAMLFAFGAGANGKSTLFRTVMGAMGDYAGAAPIETFTESKNDRHPTELARLVGMRLVVASETEKGRFWAESRVKEMTGGDLIAARFMHQDFFEFPSHPRPAENLSRLNEARARTRAAEIERREALARKANGGDEAVTDDADIEQAKNPGQGPQFLQIVATPGSQRGSRAVSRRRRSQSRS